MQFCSACTYPAFGGHSRLFSRQEEKATVDLLSSSLDGSLLRPDNFLFQASSPRLKKEEEILNLEQLERQAVEKAMRLSEGNMTRAAEYLGITRFALYRKIEKLGL